MSDVRAPLVKMINQLLQDMQIIQHGGSGYYSCASIAHRYNKLLAKARALFAEDDPLIGTFDEIPETDPKDPADKMKVMQAVRVESGQLIALLESTGEEPEKGSRK